MSHETAVLAFIILVALVFDFLNGFHDAANSIATVVSTRVLSPQKAVLWAAFFNFVAAFVLGTHVAKTLGSGMIDLKVVSHDVVLAGLLGAITWNLITWYYGIPVSSSHALIGGYAGAAMAKAGPSAIITAGWVRTLQFIVLAPLIGRSLGFFLMVAVTWIFRRWNPFRLDQLFRRLQLVSAGLYSLGHGGNDAQKTMGIITGTLVASGYLQTFVVPLWVILISHACDRLRHHVRGLAHREDHGNEDHQAPALRRLLRRDFGRDHPRGSHPLGDPRLHHPHDHGGDHGVGATRRLSAVKWGWRGASCGPGCSRSRWPRGWPRSRTTRCASCSSPRG